MKLAEALKTRKSLKALLAAKVALAKRYSYDPDHGQDAVNAVESAFTLAAQIQRLSAVIDKANRDISVDLGGLSLSLSSIRVTRDAILETRTTLEDLGSVPSSLVIRGSLGRDDEGRKVQTPDRIIPLQWDPHIVSHGLNELAKQARDLDTKLQEANWTHEIETDVKLD